MRVSGIFTLIAVVVLAAVVTPIVFKHRRAGNIATAAKHTKPPAKLCNDSGTAHTPPNKKQAQALSAALTRVFQTMPSPLPEETARGILTHAIEFTCDAARVLRDTPPRLLTLVDKQHSIGSYIPPDLVHLDNYSDTLALNKPNMQLSKIVLPDLKAMSVAANQEGVTLTISSAYRSYEYQKKLFSRYSVKMGEKQAERESARSGTSQHQLGLAIDFGSITPSFENTQTYKWLTNNAWKYGFSLSYPQNQESITGYIFESWHFRYMGKPAAAFEKKYFSRGQQYMLEILQDTQTFLQPPL